MSFLDHMTLPQIGNVAMIVIGTIALVWLFRKFGGLLSLLIVIALAALVGYGTLVASFHAFNDKALVATVRATPVQNAAHTMIIEMTSYSSDGTPLPAKSYEIGGDNWQLQCETIELQPWALLTSAKSAYQLQRLSGQYSDGSADSKAVSLGGWNFFTSLENNIGLLSPVVKSAYSSAVIDPADGRSYNVYADSAGDLSATRA